jgi:hypothetical protein
MRHLSAGAPPVPVALWESMAITAQMPLTIAAYLGGIIPKNAPPGASNAAIPAAIPIHLENGLMNISFSPSRL